MPNENITLIEKLTRGQSGDENWFDFRKGVINGSKSHEVMTKINSVQNALVGTLICMH